VKDIIIDGVMNLSTKDEIRLYYTAHQGNSNASVNE
jgi:hypothetical protein